ncbi:alpha/beta hydrolase [Cadophora sp. MPI-SDFR-AT-0126]|nr:alpha/beta hydrolase [Leotiomycetes sp. MPI-SDFR-AT-0126]
MPRLYEKSKLTLILIHGFAMSSKAYEMHYNSKFLEDKMNLLGIDLMDALGIKKAFVLALLELEIIEGIIPISALLDYGSEAAHGLGFLTPDFELDNIFYDFYMNIDFGMNCDDETRNFWRKVIKDGYRGDSGRRTLRMAVMNMRDRDGLYGRLEYVRCPGTLDALILVVNTEKEIKLFKSSLDARLLTIEGGRHVLSYSHQQEVKQNVAKFVSKYHKN